MERREFLKKVLGIGIDLGAGLYAPGSDYCTANLAQQIRNVDLKSKDSTGDSTGYSKNGVMGPNELKIDYVRNDDERFSGLVLTDVQSGLSGVLIRHQSLVGPSLEFYLLDREIKPTEKVPILDQTNIDDSYHTRTREFWNQFKGWIDDKVK